MLRAQLGEAEAVQLIEQMKNIYLHYHWKDVGSRVGGEEIVTSGGQQCGGAINVEVLYGSHAIFATVMRRT